MAELQAGTVTFLFTDLEGNTRLWEEHPEAMRPALARHDEILRDAIAAHDGHIVKTTGDGAHAAFAAPTAAIAAARNAQLGLAAERWEVTGPLRVRMGTHTCQAEVRDGDYYGSAVNRAARLMSVANGGQVVLSLATEELAREGLPPDVSLLDLGEHRLRGLSHTERVFQVCAPGLPSDFPPLQSLDAFRTNLPRQLTSFVGRDSEVAGVADALDSSPLIMITGVGGVGKTRLATHVAADVAPDFPDGVWLCELAGVNDGESETASVLVGITNDGPLAVLNNFPGSRLADGDPLLVRLDAEVGHDAYVIARVRGATMTYEEIVAYALGEIDRMLAPVTHG